MKFTILVTAVLICFLTMKARAEVSMSTGYTDTGVTIFGGAFRTPEGAPGIVGLGGPSGQSGEKSSPIVFFCGPPGETLLFEGETMIELKKRVVAHFSDCFEEMEDGQVMMVTPSGALYARKNLATCRVLPNKSTRIS